MKVKPEDVFNDTKLNISKQINMKVRTTPNLYFQNINVKYKANFNFEKLFNLYINIF